MRHMVIPQQNPCNFKLMLSIIHYWIMYPLEERANDKMFRHTTFRDTLSKIWQGSLVLINWKLLCTIWHDFAEPGIVCGVKKQATVLPQWRQHPLPQTASTIPGTKAKLPEEWSEAQQQRRTLFLCPPFLGSTLGAFPQAPVSGRDTPPLPGHQSKTSQNNLHHPDQKLFPHD